MVVKKNLLIVLLMIISSTSALALKIDHNTENVSDSVIADQRANLAKNAKGKGYGPQSPRDIDNLNGENNRIFSKAPHYTSMNLCNIHFHKNAEHKGGEFTLYAGNGDGRGYRTGFRYSGKLTIKELEPYKAKHIDNPDLQSGDTIELHYVFSSAQVAPGPTLDACIAPSSGNPQLRVEAQVFVLVNDKNALDFTKLTKHEKVNEFHQAPYIPTNTGRTIEYAGSTTGPSYNEKASPFIVTWGVRPRVAKVNIDSVYKWFADNAFDENHAHGVRNLVINPALLSSGIN